MQATDKLKAALDVANMSVYNTSKYTASRESKPLLLFFEQLRETLADFNNFCHATSRNYSFAHFTLILLLHYLVKCRNRSCTVHEAIKKYKWLAFLKHDVEVN